MQNRKNFWFVCSCEFKQQPIQYLVATYLSSAAVIHSFCSSSSTDSSSIDFSMWRRRCFGCLFLACASRRARIWSWVSWRRCRWRGLMPSLLRWVWGRRTLVGSISAQRGCVWLVVGWWRRCHRSRGGGRTRLLLRRMCHQESVPPRCLLQIDLERCWAQLCHWEL